MSLALQVLLDRLARQVRGRGVALDVQPGDAPASWVQVAYTGVWKGYRGGEFEFTAQTFAQIIANFRSHPSYRAGAVTASADDINAGKFDVAWWDFHHASEQDPTSGVIPFAGAPAQGWILELDARPGPDGVVQLWAYSRFLEPLRGYVRAGKYKWASVVVSFDAVDPVTGKNVGAYLSSVAATNDPFLQGMVPLVASRLRDIAASYTVDPWDPPRTAERVLEALRCILGLTTTAELGVVLAELAKLQAWATGAVAAPIGVDASKIVGELRALFNLPTLCGADEVFAEANKLLAALAEQAAAMSGAAAMGAKRSSGAFAALTFGGLWSAATEKHR